MTSLRWAIVDSSTLATLFGVVVDRVWAFDVRTVAPLVSTMSVVYG